METLTKQEVSQSDRLYMNLCMAFKASGWRVEQGPDGGAALYAPGYDNYVAFDVTEDCAIVMDGMYELHVASWKGETGNEKQEWNTAYYSACKYAGGLSRFIAHYSPCYALTGFANTPPDTLIQAAQALTEIISEKMEQ